MIFILLFFISYYFCFAVLITCAQFVQPVWQEKQEKQRINAYVHDAAICLHFFFRIVKPYDRSSIFLCERNAFCEILIIVLWGAIHAIHAHFKHFIFFVVFFGIFSNIWCVMVSEVNLIDRNHFLISNGQFDDWNNNIVYLEQWKTAYHTLFRVISSYKQKIDTNWCYVKNERKIAQRYKLSRVEIGPAV